MKSRPRRAASRSDFCFETGTYQSEFNVIPIKPFWDACIHIFKYFGNLVTNSIQYLYMKIKHGPSAKKKLRVGIVLIDPPLEKFKCDVI